MSTLPSSRKNKKPKGYIKISWMSLLMKMSINFLNNRKKMMIQKQINKIKLNSFLRNIWINKLKGWPNWAWRSARLKIVRLKIYWILIYKHIWCRWLRSRNLRLSIWNFILCSIKLPKLNKTLRIWHLSYIALSKTMKIKRNKSKKKKMLMKMNKK